LLGFQAARNSSDGRDSIQIKKIEALYRIRSLLEAFGTVADTWKIAAWFHYPNGRIVESGPQGIEAVAPKYTLDRHQDVLNAVEKRTGATMPELYRVLPTLAGGRQVEPLLIARLTDREARAQAEREIE
jgi:hypothetical protein